MSTGTAFVTGANRGIGLEFVKQFRNNGFEVLASCRFPEKASKLFALVPEANIFKLNVASQESINGTSKSVSNRIDRLDCLINNAGLGEKRRGLRNADFENCLDILTVNALGPLFVTKAFLPLMVKGTKVVNITSLMGSIDDNRSGGCYGYRLSKAALNMVTKNLANDLSSRGIIVISIHPGWVRTRMGGPVASISTKTSVSGMLDVLEGLTIKESGSFFNYKGEELPW